MPQPPYGAAQDADPGSGVAELSERTDRVRGLKWAKRVLVLPIGERWLLISAIAALTGRPVWVFLALLGWGALAATYTAAGRVLRALDRPGAPSPDVVPLLDLGPLLRGLGPRLAGGRTGWLWPAALAATGLAAPALLVALVEPEALPACFALLAVVAYHVYDVAYRVRTQGAAVPAWLGNALLGHEGRLLLVALLAATGTVRPWLRVVAAGVGVVAVGESSRAWRRFVRTSQAWPRGASAAAAHGGAVRA